MAGVPDRAEAGPSPLVTWKILVSGLHDSNVTFLDLACWSKSGSRWKRYKSDQPSVGSWGYDVDIHFGTSEMEVRVRNEKSLSQKISNVCTS